MFIRHAVIIEHVPSFKYVELPANKVTLNYLRNRGTKQYLIISIGVRTTFIDLGMEFDKFDDLDTALSELTIPDDVIQHYIGQLPEYGNHAIYYDFFDAGFTVNNYHHHHNRKHRTHEHDVWFKKSQVNHKDLWRSCYAIHNGLIHRVGYDRKENLLVSYLANDTLKTLNGGGGVLQFPTGVNVINATLDNSEVTIRGQRITWSPENFDLMVIHSRGRKMMMVFLGKLLNGDQIQYDVVNKTISLDLSDVDIVAHLHMNGHILFPDMFNTREEYTNLHTADYMSALATHGLTFMSFFNVEKIHNEYLDVNVEYCPGKYKTRAIEPYPLVDSNNNVIDYVRDHHYNFDILTPRLPGYDTYRDVLSNQRIDPTSGKPIIDSFSTSVKLWVLNFNK